MDSPISINTLIGGGLLLSLSSAISSKILSVPVFIFNWIYQRCTVVLTIDNTSSNSLAVVNKFMHERYSKWYRSIDISSRAEGFGFRTFWFRYKNRIVAVKQESKEVMAYNSVPVKCNTVTFTFFCFKRRTVDDFMLDLDKLHKFDKARKAYINDSYGDLTLIGDISKKSFESLVYSDNVAESVKGDVDKFLASEGFYAKHGIPYQRGYLFYGPPGSGKSSIAACIANHSNKNVVTISLSNFSDYNLFLCVARTSNDYIFLLEDIDRIQITEDTATLKANTPTMAGLLNAIDGVFKVPGRIIIATTNHIEKLDPALIRRGRFDMVVEIGYADEEQVSKYTSKFFGKSVACKNLKAGITMADVQEACISSSSVEVALSALTAKGKTLTAGVVN